ncbi:MAG: hypothetical protein J0L92_23065 [Deltaproteobacteria bacterium]|nr:hypothetical protein [Deltaproteobacteria bacterium]
MQQRAGLALALGVSSSLAIVGCGGPTPSSDDAAVTPDAAMPMGTDGGPRVDAFTPVPDAYASPDAYFEGVPPFRNPVATPDAELARQALRILGAPSAGATEVYCNDCHGLTRQTIRHWRALSDTALSECLTDLEVSSDASAADMVACFRNGDVYDTSRVGIFSTAAELSWFEYVFRHGGGTAWETEYAAFVERAGMPAADSGHPTLDQAQFDILAEWFIRGVPGLDDVLPEDPAPTTCTPGISADVAAHGARMATMGWAQRNRDAGTLMFGCAPGAAPTTCLATEERAADTTYGAEWDVVAGTTLRVLYTTDYRSAYWTRSSADGRFVSHGAAVMSAQRGRFIDLQRDVAIPASGNYDPSFFPDNSGFVFHGSRAYVCEQSLLTTPSLSTITFTESQCTNNRTIGLYEHVAAGLMGGDYWSVDGSFVSDDGGHDPTLDDPMTDFGSDSDTDFTRLVNVADEGFRVMGTTSISTPFEGDAVLAPSGELIINRISGPGGRQLGYVLRGVSFDTSGPTLRAEAPEIARYCFNGGKPAFSFDEQWMVIHHYLGAADAVDLGFTGASDPAFAEYLSQGAANVYLVNLATGARTRLTNMQPGQYALFPHFRADGWIYFTVRTVGQRAEHIVASDALFTVGG